MRRRRGLATTPSWRGSWLPVPKSTRWTKMAVASELEDSTRILHVGILASEHWIHTESLRGFLENLAQIMHLNLLKLWSERKGEHRFAVKWYHGTDTYLLGRLWFQISFFEFKSKTAGNTLIMAEPSVSAFTSFDTSVGIYCNATSFSRKNFQQHSLPFSDRISSGGSPPGPRRSAIASRGDARPRHHRGAAPGCRCHWQRYGQRGLWPRSWKSRPGFCTNLSEFFHLANSFSWRIFTNFQGMTPYDLAERGGHAMVLGWLKPVPWHCSWKGVQFHSFGEDFYGVVDTTPCASWRIRCGWHQFTCKRRELEDRYGINVVSSWNHMQLEIAGNTK